MAKQRFPNTIVIVFFLVLISAVATWLLPGGTYVTAADGSLHFEPEPSVPQTWQFFTSFFKGFVRQADIIFFILCVGGAFQVLSSTGAVDMGIRKFISRTAGHDKIVLASMALLFSAGGAIFGMSEETIPFVGLAVPLVISMGYDSIVGLLCVYVASNIGFSTAFLNPFTVGVAQKMAGLQLFSGLGYRLFCWCIFTAITIAFILIYASHHKKPTESYSASEYSPVPISIRQKLVLLILFFTMAMLIAGVIWLKWYITEIAGLFLLMGILCGIVSGYNVNKTADEFMAGAKDIFSSAIVVGLASGIVIILQDGKVMDTILNALQSGLKDSGKGVSLALMYGIQATINFFIPSATAKAAITIPIMAPFSDLIGLGRQSMVMAFQFGDGFTNLITPTSGVLVAALAMAKIQYPDWVKFVWKYVLVLLILGLLFLVPTITFPLKGF